MIGTALQDSVSDQSIAVFAEYDMQAVMIYGRHRVEEALKHSALSPLHLSTDTDYGLFRILPENLPESAQHWAKEFVANFSEYPPVPQQTTPPTLLPGEHLELLAEPVLVEYRTPYAFSQTLTFEVPAIALSEIEGLWVEVSVKELGVDFVLTKLYTRFKGQGPEMLDSIAGEPVAPWEKSILFWDSRRLPFRDFSWSEFQTIVCYIPPTGEKVWVFFDFQDLRKNYPGESLTAIRWDLNAMPAPGIRAEALNAKLELREPDQ